MMRDDGMDDCRMGKGQDTESIPRKGGEGSKADRVAEKGHQMVYRRDRES